MPRTIFGIWCPDHHVCKFGTKMFCKGPSEEDVRYRLLQHLQSAPCHKDLDEDQCKIFADEAEVKSWDEQASDDWVEEGPAKRQKQQPKQPSEPPPAKIPMPPSEAPALARLVENAVARGLAAVGAGMSSSSSSGEVMIPPPPPHPPMPLSRTNEDFVTVPRAMLHAILDHCDRAEHAARQAARLANSAALAFDSEANHIAAAKASVLSIVQRLQ